MEKTGTKHLIECNCILPQFVKKENPPFHKFVVFSQTDENGKFVAKLAQCPNCNAVHRVIDFCKSEIVPRKENTNALVSIDDIKLSMPKEISELLLKNGSDISSWEQAQFIIENEKWGEFVIISSEVIDNTKQGKFVRILGRNILKVETFSYTNSLE